MRINVPSDIGSYIATKRRQLGLSQKALADKLGKDQRFVSNLENNAGSVALGTVMSVLNVLDAVLSVIPRAQPLQSVRSDAVTVQVAKKASETAVKKAQDKKSVVRSRIIRNPVRSRISPKSPAIIAVREPKKGEQ